jgi:hypothetical protein
VTARDGSCSTTGSASERVGKLPSLNDRDGKPTRFAFYRAAKAKHKD